MITRSHINCYTTVNLVKLINIATSKHVNKKASETLKPLVPNIAIENNHLYLNTRQQEEHKQFKYI
ncbi:hypothetical protein TUM3792_44590 [Shewanella sp. MBTL60-007]|nr:hypothetical protein TUM3792_44590 [Shewanella sp. MBTL60-007]